MDIQEQATTSLVLSRHFNALTNKLNTFKAKGDYLLDTHTITAGYEREMLDVFNAFTQHVYGTFTFSSIANFQAKQAAICRADKRSCVAAYARRARKCSCRVCTRHFSALPATLRCAGAWSPQLPN